MPHGTHHSINVYEKFVMYGLLTFKGEIEPLCSNIPVYSQAVPSVLHAP